MATSGGGLVSNILKKAATFDDQYLEETIAKVEKKSSDLREEILQFLKENYDEFFVQADSSITMEQKIKDLTKEFQNLRTRIEGDLKGRLIKSSGKKEEIEKQFGETEAKISLVERLVRIYKLIEQGKTEITRKRYTTASKTVVEATQLLNQISQDGCDAKVCYALKNQVALAKSDIRCQLQEDWNTFVKWKPTIPTQELGFDAALHLKHIIPRGEVPEFEDVNDSMSLTFTESEKDGRGKRYAMKLLDGFVKPLLKHQTLEVTVTNDELSLTLGLKKLDSTRSFASCTKSIQILFTAVHNMMPKSQRKQWMSLLGQTIEPDFTPLFLKHVLSEQTPKTGTEWDEFPDIAAHVVSLQEQMKELCIVDESYSALTDYTTNVDTHIATQQCQDILQEARQLMLQPLHNTVTAGFEDTLVPLQKLNIGGLFASGTKQPRLPNPSDELNISSLTFAFPSCLISVSVKELVGLLHDTLSQCTVSTDNMAVQLYHTARDIVELFIAVSDSYHAQTVSQIPRNAMVQHNNFMYVAHNLLTIGHQFHSRIKCLTNVSFIDFVPRLRRLGEEYFLSEMEKQSGNILECLNAFETFDGVVDRQEELERAIKQAILLIYNLSKVYSETLHTDLFRRCQGGLLNVLVTELMSRTISLVDIASSDANTLNEVFEMEVIQKAPIALSLTSDTDKDKLSEVCQNWGKLNELIFILGASQNDIVNRWGNGKGLLAKQFSVAEVKHLIRAIFKNTERRAETLTKIVQ